MRTEIGLHLLKANLDRSEMDLNESEMDLNKCVMSEMDLNESEIDLNTLAQSEPSMNGKMCSRVALGSRRRGTYPEGRICKCMFK